MYYSLQTPNDSATFAAWTTASLRLWPTRSRSDQICRLLWTLVPRLAMHTAGKPQEDVVPPARRLGLPTQEYPNRRATHRPDHLQVIEARQALKPRDATKYSPCGETWSRLSSVFWGAERPQAARSVVLCRLPPLRAAPASRLRRLFDRVSRRVGCCGTRAL